MADAATWKRRQRSLAGAVVLWAVAITIAATMRPAAVAALIQATNPFQLTGAILVSIGLAGGLVESLFALAQRWVNDDTEDLTTPPWEVDDDAE